MFGNNLEIFALNYDPHEIIKKISLIMFLPLFLKTKIKIMRILKNTFGSFLKKRERVNPNGEKRATTLVKDQMNEIASDINGKKSSQEARKTKQQKLKDVLLAKNQMTLPSNW